MIPPTVFVTPVLSITWFCLWGMGKIKNDKTQKMSYIPVIPLLPLLTFTTLPSVISAERLSSHSHSQKPEPPHCKEKVITSIHSWANCSNSAVSQQSTPASKQICIYHGCLPDRFSQASWNRENVFNGSIMLMTHFLQITFASSVYCLRRIWKTSHRNEDIFFFFFFFEHIFQQKGNRQSIQKQFRWGSLDEILPFLFAPSLLSQFLSILLHYLSVPWLLFLPVLLLLWKKYI